MIFLGAKGSIGGESAEQIKAEFSGITLADTEENWLFQRTKLHPR